MALIQVRVEEEAKKEVDELFAELGFDTPTAIRMFLKKSLDYQGLPFDVKKSVPNSETVAAMKEAKKISIDANAKRYSNFAELLSEVKKDNV